MNKETNFDEVFNNLVKSGELIAAFLFRDYVDKCIIVEVITDNVILDEFKRYYKHYKVEVDRSQYSIMVELLKEADLLPYIRRISLKPTNIALKTKMTDGTNTKEDILIKQMLQNYNYFSLKL